MSEAPLSMGIVELRRNQFERVDGRRHQSAVSARSGRNHTAEKPARFVPWVPPDIRRGAICAMIADTAQIGYRYGAYANKIQDLGGREMTRPPRRAPASQAIPGGKTVLVEFEDGIAWVSMNRPEKRNCMRPTLASEMLGVINALEGDRRCQVLVLTGTGDSFSAGMDLKEFFRDNDHLSPPERAHIYRTNAAWQWRQFQFYSEADDRDGQRLVLRRRVHAAHLVRSRDRRRGGQVRPLGDQLGHHPGRRRHQGGVAGDEPARLPLLHHDRRDLRRPQGRQHGAGQRGRAAEGAARAHARARPQT